MQWYALKSGTTLVTIHDDVIKWKHFPRYWPFVRGMHRSPVNSPHKGQWRGALIFSYICARINGWVNNGEAGDLRCNRVIVMLMWTMPSRVVFRIPILLVPLNYAGHIFVWCQCFGILADSKDIKNCEWWAMRKWTLECRREINRALIQYKYVLPCSVGNPIAEIWW